MRNLCYLAVGFGDKNVYDVPFDTFFPLTLKRFHDACFAQHLLLNDASFTLKNVSTLDRCLPGWFHVIKSS